MGDKMSFSEDIEYHYPYDYHYGGPRTNDKTWTGANGVVHKIYEMETSHIENCIKLLERQGICVPYEMERELHARKTR